MKVKGGSILSITELGLAMDSITIAPRFRHKDVHVDDFGGEIPPDVMSMLLFADVRMVLSHYDPIVLGTCVAHAVGSTTAGECGPAGAMLLSRGFGIRLYLIPRNDIPWQFKASYLNSEPLEVDIGTKLSQVQLNWRCLPINTSLFTTGRGYLTEPLSRGSKVWVRELED